MSYLVMVEMKQMVKFEKSSAINPCSRGGFKLWLIAV